MKKILVTGADGFIGSHLVEELLKNKNNQITALTYYNSFNSIGWLQDSKQAFAGNKRLKIISGDICDSNFLLEITKNIDVVYHLAALVSIPYSYKSPKSFLDTNVIGSYNICASCKTNKVKKIIFTSTSEVYGTAKYTPIDEKHPLQPQSPYSASKISAEAIAKSFYNSYNLPIIIVRPFNTFGPRQSLRAIVPSIILQALDNKVIEVGNLKPTRDLNYVKDVCRAFIAIEKSKIKFGEIINIGSGKEISVKQLIFKVQKILRINKKIFQKKIRLRPVKSEVFRLLANNKKLTSNTKYKPHYDFSKGLLETIHWYKKNIKTYSRMLKDYNI